MKIYLDDERLAPPGWVQARWPDEVIEHLKSGDVTDVSLDHDLGDDERGTGYDVILWIENAVVTNGFQPPTVTVHSAISSARLKMEAGSSPSKGLLRRMIRALDKALQLTTNRASRAVRR